MPGESKSRPKVLIACPNGSAWIHKLVVFSVIRMLQDRRYEATFIAPTHKPFVNNLHLIVRDFLEGDWDFLLSIDDDNPPLRNPLELADLDLDVIGCPTPIWYSDMKNAPGDRPFYLNALRQVQEEDGAIGFKPLDTEQGFVPAGLKAADAVGTGCVMIARRVLKALHRKAVDGAGPLDSPFFRTWHPDGVTELGNDYAFCLRAREAGFKIWAHFDYQCDHINELPLVETINAMMAFRLKPE